MASSESCVECTLAKNKLAAQRARMPANKYVINREPIVGISTKVVNNVPKTFPIVEIP
jgi:hypothetical protein